VKLKTLFVFLFAVTLFCACDKPVKSEATAPQATVQTQAAPAEETALSKETAQTAVPEENLSLEGQLLKAAKEGDDEKVSTLIDALEAEVNSPAEEQLVQAILKGDVRQVKTLLDAGADANSKYLDVFDHSTPILVSAAEGGYTEIVRLLLEKGATDKDEAFRRAVWFRKWEAATLLRDAGANTVIPNDCTGYEEFVIPSIQQQKSEELLSFIRNTKTMDDAAAATIKQLIADGADINYTEGDDAEGDCACGDEPPLSPLIVAIRHKNLRLVKFLLGLKADVNRVAVQDCGDGGKIYATAWSESLGDKKITDLLVRYMDKNKNAESLAAMLRAGVLVDDVDTVKLALQWGADANTKDDEFTSLLVLAAQNGHTEIVRLLLEKGAMDKDEAFETAVRFEKKEVASLLKAAGAREKADTEE